MLERLVADQLITFMESNCLLDPFQSAYRKGHGTQTVLTRITNYVSEGIDHRQLRGMVLFDFSKAFDRVRHNILLNKLGELQVSDSVRRWFAAYLFGRSQAVLGEGSEKSQFLTTTTGVPQGSVLGPLLFMLYMHDIRFALAGCDHSIYAGNLQIFCRGEMSNIDNVGSTLNKDILLTRIWASLNGLALNSDKSHAILFGSSAYVRRLEQGGLPLLRNGSTTVPFEKSVKLLGVIMSDDFRWRGQASSVARAINSALYRLKVCRALLSRSARVTLVNALIAPIVDYCSVILHGITDEKNKIIDVAFNSCVRFIFDVSRFDHITPY